MSRSRQVGCRAGRNCGVCQGCNPAHERMRVYDIAERERLGFEEAMVLSGEWPCDCDMCTLCDAPERNCDCDLFAVDDLPEAEPLRVPLAEIARVT